MWARILSGSAAALCLYAGTDPAALVSRMSLDEKIALLHGTRDPEELGQAGYWPGLPRLGISPLRFADGPPGVCVNRDTTAMPAPVALASTFSEDAARLYGEVMGREARASRQQVLLSPHINIVRDPLFRRNHTTFSEDPLLTSRIAAAQILGIQSQGVMAQVKHLAGYNGSENVRIDDRTLHEIYLPAFEAAVKVGAASVMCAYNQINGKWACENSDLQIDLLRRQWGFNGFVTSDWGAIHSAAAITKGTDLEMPGRPITRRGGPWFGDALKSAVESGTVSESVLDQALVRILSQMERFGLLRRQVRSLSIDVESHAAIVRQIAEQGAVLLKNEDRALPLIESDLGSLAVIGPAGGQLAAGFMGERGYGFGERLVAPLDALRRTAPHAKITYSVGVDLTGQPVPGVPEAVTNGEYEWSGTVTAETDGDYTFLVQPAGEGGGTIEIDGIRVAKTGGPGFGGTGMVARKWSSLLPTTHGRDNSRGSIRLAAGSHTIRVLAHSTAESAVKVRFAWITPRIRRAAIDRAAAVARSVRTPVIFAWSSTGTFVLPEDQDELIESAVRANPRTIVVLNTGGPVAMPWKDRVRAILEMWYPGQEGGWATANLLLGRANPSGRLPVTFPVRVEDAPARAGSHPERLPQGAPPGAGGVLADTPMVRFTEGIFVGYRWYDAEGIDPLFPFGHGLSYSAFEYSDLRVDRRAITFAVRNTGTRVATEVAQVYVGPPVNSGAAMPLRSLAGFRAVTLQPGRTARVRIEIPERQLSWWSSDRRAWILPTGSRTLSVGSSSRNILLTTSFEISVGSE